MGHPEPKNLNGQFAFPIRAGVGTAQLAPPWSRSQVNWAGKGYYVLRLATEGVSRWLLGASFDWGRIFPHERTFRRPALHKSMVIQSLKMNPWPVHMASDVDDEQWRLRLSELVRNRAPIVDTDYVTLWMVSVLPKGFPAGSGRCVVLDGHHSRKAQRYLGSSRIFGWVEPLSSPELKVRALHRCGSLTDFIDDCIREGELRVLPRAVEPVEWTMDRSLAFEVVQADRRIWCEIARPLPVGGRSQDRETCIDAISRLARQKRAFLRTSSNFEEILGLLERMEIDTGLRLPPPNKAAVWNRAIEGALFPQKATSFYPKLPFGLLVDDLK